METVANTLALAEKYGLSMVMLILLGVFLIPKVNSIWKEYESMRTSKESEAKRLAALNVDVILHFDLRVKSILNELMKQIGCDWTQLWQFHNGVYSLGMPHIPLLYVSITHEVTSDSVMPMSMIYKQLPTTMFKDSGEKILTDDVIVTTLTEGASEISKTFAIGAMSNAILPIRDCDAKLTALLSIGFAKPHTFTPEDETAMKIASRQLGIFLAIALMEIRGK